MLALVVVFLWTLYPPLEASLLNLLNLLLVISHYRRTGQHGSSGFQSSRCKPSTLTSWHSTWTPGTNHTEPRDWESEPLHSGTGFANTIKRPCLICVGQLFHFPTPLPPRSMSGPPCHRPGTIQWRPRSVPWVPPPVLTCVRSKACSPCLSPENLVGNISLYLNLPRNHTLMLHFWRKSGFIVKQNTC